MENTKTIFKYSELVTLDNKSKKETKKVIETKLLRGVLDNYVLHFDGEENLDICVDLLIGKIYKLPAGTLFSIRSLVITHNRTFAQSLGKRLRGSALTDDAFTFLSSYTGKSVYRREKKNLNSIEDFSIHVNQVKAIPYFTKETK